MAKADRTGQDAERGADWPRTPAGPGLDVVSAQDGTKRITTSGQTMRIRQFGNPRGGLQGGQ